MITVDLAAESVRDLNQRLHDLPADTNERACCHQHADSNGAESAATHANLHGDAQAHIDT